MSSVLPGQPMRVLSGMRPTGRLHLLHSSRTKSKRSI